MTIVKLKYNSAILFAFFLIGCSENNPKKTEKPETTELNQVTELDTTEIASTSMDIVPVMHYPSPFRCDTIITEFPIGKAKNNYFKFTFNSLYPVSDDPNHSLLNKKVEELIKIYVHKHIFSENGDSVNMDIQADLIATNFFLDSNYIGILFTEQDYYEGAAHYNHGYISLNYDLKRNKEIKLTDLILFKSGEAQKFCDAFNPDYTTDSKYKQVDLEGKDFTDDRPFMVNGDEIVLYFHDAEKSPSLEKVYIPYSKIKGYVNPVFRILFE